MTQFRFAVVQLGARLHYAVPVVLEQAGLLEALYTDAHDRTLAVRILGRLPGLSRLRGMRRLLARRVPAQIPVHKIRGWSWPSFQIELYNRLLSKETRRKTRHWHERKIGGHWLAKKVIETKFNGANALYVHASTCTDAVVEARRRGMFVVIEAISHPFNKYVEKEEYEKFGMSLPEPEAELRDNLEFFREEVILADLVLAASPYVREGLIELGLDPARIAVVPYGLDSSFLKSSSAPVPGRVLYVGNIGYLKGVPYLAEATRMLNAAEFSGEIRAVGPCDPALISRPEFAGPTYVGQVPRSEIKNEFSSSDVFVFPTLSDGFGMVILEAMAAGLPVICTPNCAGIVKNGENGLVIPTRDPKAIANAILQIVNDRGLRERMSIRAKATAAEFDLSSYERKLVQGIAEAAVNSGS